MRPTLIALVAFGALGACTPAEQFQPVSANTVGETSEREIAADYHVRANGQPAGDVRVYSKGAYDSGHDTTLVHVGFDVHNRLATPVRLSCNLMTSVRTDEGTAHSIPPFDSTADRTIPPGTSRKIDVVFELPEEEMGPQDVDAFTVSWTLEGTNLRYEQATSFVEKASEYQKASDKPFNAPFEPYDGLDYPYRSRLDSPQGNP
jgi:hypothetical protein